MKKLGIYIHIPFCVRKCPYCGFLSAPPESEEQTASYVDALVKEIGIASEAYGRDRLVDTVFIGGGTPSVLSHEQTGQILDSLAGAFTLDENPEITIEANPGTLTEEKLKAYAACGINRLSIGAQSFDDGLLESIGRIHRREDVVAVYEDARKAGFENINLDLMFGLGGQTMEKWEETLREAVSLDPEHISFYSLQIEENTPFYDLYKAGKLDTASDTMEREMHHKAIHTLQDAGFEHYEISNSAKPGRQCLHNLKYWSMAEYAGLGLGAHSYIENGGTLGLRYNNTEDMTAYIGSIGKGELPIEQRSLRKDTEKDAMGIYMFTGLRKREGVDLADFKARFGLPFESAFDMDDSVRKWQDAGYTEKDNGRFRLTEKGIDKSNDIMSEFV
ncbi:MAG: radical SAM family heme chaperone HemW [Bacillota bacterium]|nr:radical SAM family heme chaperone HemW [Bacillota bacterium]